MGFLGILSNASRSAGRPNAEDQFFATLSSEDQAIITQTLFVMPTLPWEEWHDLNREAHKVYAQEYLPAMDSIEAAALAAYGSLDNSIGRQLATIKQLTAPDEHAKQAFMHAVLRMLVNRLPKAQDKVAAGSFKAAEKELQAVIGLIEMARRHSDKLRMIVKPQATLLSAAALSQLQYMIHKAPPSDAFHPNDAQAAAVLASEVGMAGAKGAAKMITRLFSDSAIALPADLGTTLAKAHVAEDDLQAFHVFCIGIGTMLPECTERLMEQATSVLHQVQSGLGGDPRYYGGWLQDGFTMLTGIAAKLRETSELCQQGGANKFPKMRNMMEITLKASDRVLRVMALFCRASIANQYLRTAAAASGSTLENLHLSLALDTQTAVEAGLRNSNAILERVSVALQLNLYLGGHISKSKLSPEAAKVLEENAEAPGGASSSAMTDVQTPEGGSSSQEVPAGCNPINYFPDTTELEQSSETAAAMEKLAAMSISS